MDDKPDVLRDLLLLVRSRYGLVHVATPERDRAGALFHHLADRLALPLFAWNRLEGLRRVGMDGPVYDTADAGRALEHVVTSEQPALYHFHDLAPDLEQGTRIRELLGAAARSLENLDGAVLLTGTEPSLGPELERRSARIRLPDPDEGDFEALLSRILRDMARRSHVEISLSDDERASLVSHLRGLTLLEAEKVLTKAIVEDGHLTADDIHHVIDAKRKVVEREGLLEYYPAEEGLESVADMAGLKRWLAKRKAVIRSPDRAAEFGLEFPRGMLLLGVPGCGKSLAAKAVAWEWTLPLLKLDPSNLYNKYIGESERNFKRAMETAERISPVVLWIDELEKAFASGGGEDGGVSQRVLGSFLTWMQERRGDVFVVATANDIESLPPEFLRKGRFDEIFFVDLPDTSVRKEIFRIHLERRGQEPQRFPLSVLARAAEGFSGAEIEEVVVAGMYTAFADDEELTPEILHREIQGTRPLSVTREGEVRALRQWARDRATPAG